MSQLPGVETSRAQGKKVRRMGDSEREIQRSLPKFQIISDIWTACLLGLNQYSNKPVFRIFEQSPGTQTDVI